MKVKGSWVAIPTPFNEDGSINFEGFEEIVDFHVRYGTDGLLVLGSAGEASMLSKKEKMEVIEFITDYASGKIPVLVGTTGPNTAESIEMTSFAYKCNADGALMVVPSYIKPPQSAIYDFFKDVSSAVDIPIAVYNNPTRVGVNIKPETMIKLGRLPNIVAIKEAMPDVSQLIKVRIALGDEMDVLTCDAPPYSIILPNLAIGGSGVTSITGNLAPEEFIEMSRPWQEFKDVVRARELVFKYFELMELCYSITNPVVIKAGMNLLGLPAGKPRLPLQELKGEKLERLKQVMDELGLLEKYSVYT